MKHRHLILAFIIVVVLAASSAWSQKEETQEGIMDLKSKGFSKHFQPKVRFDHYYLLNQSFLLDLKIIFQTVLRVFLRDGVSH